MTSKYGCVLFQQNCDYFFLLTKKTFQSLAHSKSKREIQIRYRTLKYGTQMLPNRQQRTFFLFYFTPREAHSSRSYYITRSIYAIVDDNKTPIIMTTKKEVKMVSVTVIWARMRLEPSFWGKVCLLASCDK